jgi:hypothetical protein
MTTEEAISMIETAQSPADLFGDDAPRRDYRRLARLTHPDTSRGDPHAAAFDKLTTLWRRREGTSDLGRLVARGDIANLYASARGLLKLARRPADNDLLDREVTALTRLRNRGDERYQAYVPRLLETQSHRDPDSGLVRRANLFGRLDGFRSLAEVRAAFPDGVDPRDAAWMWRRLLAGIGYAHRAGVVHAAVLPEHVMIHPGQHGLVLVDWCYSVTSPGDRVPAIVGRYQDWYPPELTATRAAHPGTDIYLAARCMTHLMGERAPRPLTAFAAGCTLVNPRRRPLDAWRLLAELDDVLERHYGPRTFRPFVLPPVA